MVPRIDRLAAWTRCLQGLKGAQGTRLRPGGGGARLYSERPTRRAPAVGRWTPPSPWRFAAGPALHGMGHVTVADISAGREPTCITGQDVEAHHLSEFQQYLTDSVLHDGTPLSEVGRPLSNDAELLEDDEGGCECGFAADGAGEVAGWTCTARDGDTCDCVANTGNFYATPGPSGSSEQEQVLHLDALPARLPLVECSARCLCSAQCSNRLTQRGVRVPLTIRPIHSLGLGAFYTPDGPTPLAKGRFIALYAGEYLTTSQARERWSAPPSFPLGSDAEGKGNYILSLRVGTAGDEVWHIDPRHRGNVGRFLNHSCEPNCVIHFVYWGSGGYTWPRTAIFVRAMGRLGASADGQTKRVVRPGEELTFDYANASGDTSNATPSSGGVDAPLDDVEGTRHTRVRCLCGARRCRGWMPFDETL